MVSRKTIFWEVDTQADFMLPGGKLYVPGAEKIIPNVGRLADAARQDRVLLVSDACFHTAEDEEFRQWPPHCLRGTPGAEIIPEGRAERVYSVPNRAGAQLPAKLEDFQQVVLEKQTLDVFDNPNTEVLLERLDSDAEFVVFGVVTEYCVRCASKGLLERGRRVTLVTDAIETLNPVDGQRTLQELTAKGARLLSTNEALALLPQPVARSA
ncbi:MAG TPA: cysteine hydrolase family protein [Candidatus Acidoferrales bacterium]|nr:cysteine hydrolase family protein [Candidatus Acidoferrales bacterium]